jgi:GT2 family glycosyltransferase
MYGEDTLLGWQLMRRGAKQCVVDSAVIRHKGQDRTNTCNLFYEYQLARAHVLLSCKAYRHPFEIPVLLLSKSIGLLMRASLRSLRYRSGLPVLAFALAWFPIKIRKS